MTHWTEQEYYEYMARRERLTISKREEEPDPGPESDLQGKIMKWATDNGYPCLCFKQSKQARGFLVPGWPD